jgi:PleD family two-component response regulator
VAELNDTEAPADAIARADAAMYLAKRAGKNRVVPA